VEAHFPDSIVQKNEPFLQISNFSSRPLRIQKGEVVGLLHDPRDWLDRWNSANESVNLSHAKAVRTFIEELKHKEETQPEVESQEPIEGGPKTAEVPEMEPIPADDLLKVVDLPKHLDNDQRTRLEDVLRRHERAFGLDGRLPTPRHQRSEKPSTSSLTLGYLSPVR